MALSLPPDQQKRMGCVILKLLLLRITAGRQDAGVMGWRHLVLTAEAVVHADADVAGERGIANDILILLIEEIGDAGVDGYAAEQIEAGREVEPAIAGVL